MLFWQIYNQILYIYIRKNRFHKYKLVSLVHIFTTVTIFLYGLGTILRLFRVREKLPLSVLKALVLEIGHISHYVSSFPPKIS